MRIPEEKIREVQNKADIVSVISKYTKLQKKGQDYVGLCLFHQDNNPSMSVSPIKHYFKCFSCGVGGNVFEFLMKYKHLSFIEAVMELATEFNVDLGNISSFVKKDKYSLEEKTLFEINQAAMKYYQVNLNAVIGKPAKEYLLSRNLDQHQIQQWEIGYAVGNEIIDHLKKLGYTEKQIVDAGLATKTDTRTFDYFTNRIVFPIKNQDGYVIGFSGRVLTDEKPKYLNTRETLVFKKSDILFNLNNVWKIKESLDSVILLEGFMDVISLEKIQVHNSMALMGTAFSKFHLKTILEMKQPVKLFLDGDVAGMEAMYKIAEVLIKNKVKFSIIDNLTNQDPDELVNDNKSNEVLKMINNPINPYEYFLTKMLVNQEELNFDQINEFSQKILNLLKDEQNYILVDQVINKLSSQLKVSPEALTKQLDEKRGFKNNSTFKPNIKPVSKSKNKKRWDKYDIGRNRIFISLLKSSDFVDLTEDSLSQIAENNFTYEKTLKTLISFYRNHQYSGNDLNGFFNLIDQAGFINQEVEFIQDLIEDPMYGFDNNILVKAEEFHDIINEFKIRDLEKQYQSLQNNLKKLEAEKKLATNAIDQEILKEKILNINLKIKKLNDKKKELINKENQ